MERSGDRGAPAARRPGEAGQGERLPHHGQCLHRPGGLPRRRTGHPRGPAASLDCGRDRERGHDRTPRPPRPRGRRRRRPGGRWPAVNIALLRVVAQRLAGPRPDIPAGVVAHLSALQGQDLRGAVRSVALRTDPAAGDLAAREAAVQAELARGTVVRSWPMRGTLHLVPARDLHWMLSLTRPRMEAGAARRREQLGIDEPLYAHARDLVEAALGARGPLSRADLVEVLEPVGAGEVQGRTYHLLHLLAIREVIVQ
ncbi:MAG: hypothetical protein EOL89_15225, partial [Actinobacteria bacterium]|nr:hypothetical protein [Actinomycetota bacterium]